MLAIPEFPMHHSGVSVSLVISLRVVDVSFEGFRHIKPYRWGVWVTLQERLDHFTQKLSENSWHRIPNLLEALRFGAKDFPV